MTTVVVLTLILAIGAITVLSRQNAGRKLQMAEKTNSVKTNVAAQDVQVKNDPQPQEVSVEDAQKLGAGLKELVNQSTDGLVEVHHPNGSVSIDLEDRFQNVTVARINKDGSISQSCVDNPRAAGAFFGIDPKLIDNKEDAAPKPKKVTPAQPVD